MYADVLQLGLHALHIDCQSDGMLFCVDLAPSKKYIYPDTMAENSCHHFVRAMPGVDRHPIPRPILDTPERECRRI